MIAIEGLDDRTGSESTVALLENVQLANNGQPMNNLYWRLLNNPTTLLNIPV